MSISSVAGVDRLLVVCDFDGTLAGISKDPMNVPVNETSVAALQQLAQCPNTLVYILSGRSIAQLDVVCPTTAPIRRVGSHGAEPDGMVVELTDAQQATLDGVAGDLEEICEGIDGAFVEYKPFQRVFHFIRVADQQLIEQLLARVDKVDPRGAHVHSGKRVVEFSVADATKGSWIRGEQERWNPDATVFLGDDTTDETGFAVLGGNDLGVKVGPGETAATMRVADLDEVAQVLTELAQRRCGQQAAE